MELSPFLTKLGGDFMSAYYVRKAFRSKKGKHKRNLRWKFRLTIEILVVLSRLLAFLTVILNWIHERS